MKDLLNSAESYLSRSERAIAAVVCAVFALIFAVDFGTSIGKLIYLINH